MRVVFASDENYFPYIYVSVLTLLESNRTEHYNVTYIYQNVRNEKIEYLKILGNQYGRKIDAREYQMPAEYDALPSYADSRTTYAKFLFATMFPQDETVLYLDPDTIIMDSLNALFKIELGNYLIAGVPECLPYYHKNASKMSCMEQYINGGMVLCNLKQWRTENFEERAMIRLRDTRLNLNYDQGILNELCSGRIKILHPKYNMLAEMFEFKSAEKLIKRYRFRRYYSQKVIDSAIEHPVIIHFTGFLYCKPLSVNCTHPYADYFRKKLQECPYQVKLSNDNLNIKQKMRKWTLYHMPFAFYLFLEDVLDLRRRWMLAGGKKL